MIAVFLCFFIDGTLVLEDLPEDLVTSTNVTEEVTYVLIKQKAKEIKGEKTHYELLTFLRKNPQHLRKIFEKIKKDIETVFNLKHKSLGTCRF